MENVHILTQRLPTRGDYLPFNSEQYSTQGGEHYARLVDKLQTTLNIEELLTIYAEHVARISKISGLQFHCSLG
ncbi:GGDEF domain-containing protein, partial [Pseudoalteromonas phenolica]